MKRERGFSFIELAISLVLLGLVSALVINAYPALKRTNETTQSVRNVNDVEGGMVGFVFAEGRLPCADTDGDGIEDCPATVGKVPYVTMGLGAPIQNGSGLDLKYGVYARSDAVPMLDSNLTAVSDRYRPSIAQGSPVTLAQKAYGNSTVMDFCQGLRPAMAARGTINPAYVRIADGSNKEHVAYVLVDPGVGDMDLDGSPFDGSNASGLEFEHPVRAQGLRYDDRVTVAYFDELWEKLGCSGVMATAGHAHPNIESTLVLFQQEMDDYLAQVKLSVDMAFADNFSTGASIASAAAGLATAVGNMFTDIASAINTAGVTSGASVSDAIAITLNGVGVGLAAAQQLVAIDNLDTFRDRQADLEDLIANKLDPLVASVKTNVSRSDARAYSNQ